MALNKQVHLYGIDTSYFYNEKEDRINFHLNKLYIKRAEIKKKKESKVGISESEKLYYTKLNKSISRIKSKLVNQFECYNGIRTLNSSKLRDSDVISVFDSMLTRTIGCKINELTKDIVILQTYYFQIFESIMKQGFMWEDELYVPYTASAGQIRTKKMVLIKKSTLDKHNNTLTCGLTVDKINEKGGVNTNKYMAYLALNNSATDEWIDFDIDKVIVVKDFENCVKGIVDYIDIDTYELEPKKEMEVPIPHMDGCGICLPSVSKKSRMIRSAWVKGLLVPFDYRKFIDKYKERYPDCSKVKDIYGKEYDIIKDDIQVILTKSQFKMWKYYKDWQEYKDNFKKYGCQVGYCNEELDNPPNAKINYQMLQTLSDMTQDEVNHIVKNTNDIIKKIGSDRASMMRILGATETNPYKNFHQKSILLYPELLKDEYGKSVLKQVKSSIVKDAKAGKLFLDSKYTFIVPDLYAFCEWLFLGIENPKGILENNQVSCKLYNDKKLAVLRSPHLYMEWAIRDNISNTDTQEWFITNGVYVSIHDLISKILMFDRHYMSN